MAKLTRNISEELLSWKNSSTKKPLLLRGARQVGKTYIVRELGKTFQNFIEINFLENKEVQIIFQKNNFNIEQIISEISAYFSTQIIDGSTLLFLDEVQACPQAIEALRFFYEKRPNLHVVATGSLLEFAIGEIPSFGVGRIQNLFMHPLTFKEFLRSQNKTGLLDNIEAATPRSALPEVIHIACLEQYKNFLLIGGMPEVVSTFFDTNSLLTTTGIIENIIIGYEDDFQKYRKRTPTDRLRDVLRSSALQAGKKFIYRHAYLDANSQAVHEALNLLTTAGLIHKVFHSDSNGLPLGAEIDRKKFKTIPIDIGIYQRLLGLRLKDLISLNMGDLINKGALVETAVGQEILANSSAQLRPEIFYWHRESQSSNAEVDYIVEVSGKIIPVEVKASKKGSMQSLRVFLNEKKKDIGVRVSFENFSAYTQHNDSVATKAQGTVVIIPAYAVSEIERVVSEL